MGSIPRKCYRKGEFLSLSLSLTYYRERTIYTFNYGVKLNILHLRYEHVMYWFMHYKLLCFIGIIEILFTCIDLLLVSTKKYLTVCAKAVMG